eukprot:gene20680-biopygen4101
MPDTIQEWHAEYVFSSILEHFWSLLEPKTTEITSKYASQRRVYARSLQNGRIDDRAHAGKMRFEGCDPGNTGSSKMQGILPDIIQEWHAEYEAFFFDSGNLGIRSSFLLLRFRAGLFWTAYCTASHCSALLRTAPGCSRLLPAAPACSWLLRAAPCCSVLLHGVLRAPQIPGNSGDSGFLPPPQRIPDEAERRAQRNGVLTPPQSDVVLQTLQATVTSLGSTVQLYNVISRISTTRSTLLSSHNSRPRPRHSDHRPPPLHDHDQYTTAPAQTWRRSPGGATRPPVTPGRHMRAKRLLTSTAATEEEEGQPYTTWPRRVRGAHWDNYFLGAGHAWACPPPPK